MVCRRGKGQISIPPGPRTPAEAVDPSPGACGTAVSPGAGRPFRAAHHAPRAGRRSCKMRQVVDRSTPAPPKRLTPQAERALKEAQERRQRAQTTAAAPQAPEVGGRRGPDPTRYGDWEKNGIASDF